MKCEYDVRSYWYEVGEHGLRECGDPSVKFYLMEGCLFGRCDRHAWRKDADSLPFEELSEDEAAAWEVHSS